VSVKRLYLHPVLERVWHGVHTLAILTLCLSGAHIHWPEAFPVFGSFLAAVVVHNICGLLVTIDFALWIPYILLTGRFRHYVPLKRDFVGGLIRQARFYAFEVFRGAPHPFETTVDQKFNPLQKWSYVGVMFGMMPPLILTGIVMMFPGPFASLIAAAGGMQVVAIVHTILAFCAAAFLVAHVYMASMGYTPLDAYKSMITGWAQEESHGEHAEGETGGKAKDSAARRE
jgi:thiosulfate reductase cytochrome b subunit